MKNFMSLLAGAVVGGAIALLLAPEKGEVTREKLKKQGDKLGKEFETEAKKGMEKLKDLREKGEEKLAELKTATEELVENAAKKVNSTN